MTQQTTAARIFGVISDHIDFHGYYGDQHGATEAADIIAAEIDKKDARIAELEEALESQVERSNWNNLTEAEKSRVLGMKP